MSDEQPRMSRREMRAKGLLAPILDGASPIDDLTPTAEIRLKRLTRKEMRERDLAAEKAKLTGEMSAIRPGVEAPSSVGQGSSTGATSTGDLSATSRWQRQESDSAHVSGPVTGTGRVASHADFTGERGRDGASREGNGHTGSFERIGGTVGLLPSREGEGSPLGGDSPSMTGQFGSFSDTGSIRQTGSIQQSGELNALGQSTTSWTPPESTSPVEASIMGGRIVGGNVIIDSPDEQSQSGAFGEGSGFSQGSGYGEASGFGGAPASFEEATGIAGVPEDDEAADKSGFAAAKKIGGRFSSAKRETDKAMDAGKRTVFGRFAPGDSQSGEEGALPEGVDPQGFAPEGYDPQTNFDLEANGMPEQAGQEGFFQQDAPEGFQAPDPNLTDGIPGFSDKEDDETSFDPTKALKTPLLKRLRGKGKKDQADAAKEAATAGGPQDFSGGYPGFGGAYPGPAGDQGGFEAGPGTGVGPVAGGAPGAGGPATGVGPAAGGPNDFAPMAGTALAEQDGAGQTINGTAVNAPAVNEDPQGFPQTPEGMSDAYNAEDAFAEEEKPRGRMVTLLLILLFMIVGATLGIIIRRYLFSEGDVAPALQALAVTFRLPGI